METTEDIGKVVAVNGSKIKIEIERGGGCKSCAMRGMCFAKNSPAVFELESDLALAEGDKVSLEIAPATRILGSITIFLVPVIFLFLGFIIASQWLGELASIGVSFASMAASFLIVRWVDRRFGKQLDIRIGEKL